MAGAEVVLGILPLLIAAAEHWDDCLRPFKRYRKFATEVHHFQQHLKIQRTIFRNQCRILLDNATQDDLAGPMLKEPSHPSWSDPDIERQLATYLAESRDACHTAVQLIRERLDDVYTESGELGAVVAQDQDVRWVPSVPMSWSDRALTSGAIPRGLPLVTRHGDVMWPRSCGSASQSRGWKKI